MSTPANNLVSKHRSQRPRLDPNINDSACGLSQLSPFFCPCLGVFQARSGDWTSGASAIQPDEALVNANLSNIAKVCAVGD